MRIRAIEGCGCSPSVENLSTKCKALGPNPSAAKKKKEKKKEKPN
jgi:hypothetical protein